MKRLPRKYHKLRNQKLDLAILARGGIRLYHRDIALGHDVYLLAKKRYQIIEFDGHYLSSKAEILFELEQKLKLPPVGNNYDRFNDYLYDFSIGDNGVVLVFRHLYKLEIEVLYILLDTLAFHVRRKIVIGQKLLTLVQLPSRCFSFKEPIGALNFELWNDIE